MKVGSEEYFLKRLEELKVFPFFGDVRGKGLMTTIEGVKDQKTKEPFSYHVDAPIR